MEINLKNKIPKKIKLKEKETKKKKQKEKESLIIFVKK